MHGAITAVRGQTIDIEPIFGEPCKWAALLTTSGAERKATIWLKIRQFNPYWPRYKGTVKLNRHRREMRWRSVIAGYIFVPMPDDRELNWQLAEKTPGIRSIKRPDDTPIILTTSDIADVRRIEGALNASVVAAANGIPFKVGEFVRFEIVGREFTGPILEIDKHRQITVEVDLFGHRTRLALPADKIEAV